MANNDKTQIERSNDRNRETSGTSREEGRLVRDERSELGAYEARSPFAFMRRMMDDMDRLFGDFGFGGSLMPSSMLRGEGLRGWVPALDVYEADGNLVVRADLPGMKPDDVKLELRDDMLVISGERKDERSEQRGDWRHRETSYGRFERAIRVPEGADPASCDATFNHGVLEVKMKLPEQPKPRSIPIKTTGSSTGAPKGGKSS